MLEIVRNSPLLKGVRALTPHWVAGVVTGLGLLATLAIAETDRSLLHRHESQHAEEHLFRVSDNLERILERRLGLATSLASLVESYYDAEAIRDPNYLQRLEADFQNLTVALDGQLGNSLSVQLAPDGLVTFLTNFARNRKASGYDIFSDGRRMSAILSAIHGRELLFVGPIELVQGGEAIIARQPIFIPGALDREAYISRDRATAQTPWLQELPSDFWGVASVLIETNTLYRDAGLHDLPAEYDFALRGRNAQGMAGEVFWGDPAVFERPQRTVGIILPSGKWVMGVRLDFAYWPRTLLVVAIGSSLSLALGYAAWIDRRAKASAYGISQAKSEFLAVMSHELRTPMNGIIGLTDLALQADRDEERLRYLGKIQTSSQLLLRIVNDVLDFSKLDAGKLAIAQVPFSLDEAIAALSDSLSTQAASKQIELLFRIGADVPDLLVGDSLRVTQIAINLVANGIKFTNAGSVTLEIAAIETRDERIALRFDVTDTGIGLTDAQIPALFEAFTQAGRFDEREYGGTGLGLAICKRLTEAMGGEISASSQVGRGSCFRVRLSFGRVRPDRCTFPSGPAVGTRAPEALLPLTDLRRRWRGKRALVAEASAASGEALGATLSGLGLDVTVVRSSELAIESLLLALETQPFDLLLLDDTLPEANGRGAIANLDADFLLPPFARVLLCSPGRPTPEVAQLERDGFDAHLGKPIDRRQLRQLFQFLDGCERRPTARPKLRDGRALTPPISHAISTPTSSRAISGRTSRPASARCSPPLSGPLASQSVPDASPPCDRATRRHPTGETILLVEDNEVNQFVAQEMLRNLNYCVEIAENGRVALDRVRQVRYDLILMDVQMPIMGGVEATRRIRQLAAQSSENAWCGEVTIVAMTAHNAENHRQHCLDAGMNDWLPKPIDASLLQEILRQWIPGETARAVEAARPVEATKLTARESLDVVRTVGDRDRPSKTGQTPEDPSSTVIPGIAVEVGLERMGGDWDSYCELLELFAQTYAGFERDLEAALRDRRSNRREGRAAQLAHTLKGSAGNIGAHALVAASLNLERQLKADFPAPDRLQAAQQQLVGQLRRVLGSIGGALKSRSYT